MQDMSIARDLTICEGLNVRVAGEAMIRGGVERIRWRARDSKGTTVLGSARDVSVMLGGARTTSSTARTDLCWQPWWCGEERAGSPHEEYLSCPRARPPGSRRSTKLAAIFASISLGM